MKVTIEVDNVKDEFDLGSAVRKVAEYIQCTSLIWCTNRPVQVQKIDSPNNDIKFTITE